MCCDVVKINSYQSESFHLTYVECSQQLSHSDFLLEHFSGNLFFESVFNIDFPSMIRLNNIIAAIIFAVCGNYRVCGECLICLTRSQLTLARKNAVPLDWLKSQNSLLLPNRH